MPTQKISSHPKPGMQKVVLPAQRWHRRYFSLASLVELHYFLPLDPPLSNSSLQQCQSLSKSASAMISSKQAHSELTAQRLQQFLDRKQQSPLQEEPFSLRKNSNIIVKAKDAPIAHTSKAKQTKENVPVRRRRRSRTPKEEDGCLVSAPKAPASKALQENKPPEVKARANQDLSSKEKVN